MSLGSAYNLMARACLSREHVRFAFGRASAAFVRNTACCIATITFLGCGSDGLVPVSGQVTLDGTPVSSGRVEFYPEVGRPASGAIGSDGRYSLTTDGAGEGVEPGKYAVTITAREAANQVPKYKSMEDEMNGVINPEWKPSKSDGVEWLVPQRYSNRALSDLTADVTAGGDDIDFQLQSKR